MTPHQPSPIAACEGQPFDDIDQATYDQAMADFAASLEGSGMTYRETLASIARTGQAMVDSAQRALDYYRS